MNNHLHIVFASDDNYSQHMGVSILSLFETNTSFEEITVYILDNGIGKFSKKNLYHISKGFVNRNVIFIEMQSKLNLFKEKYDIPSTISITSYARLFLSELLENDINRVIYADSDSLILNSLRELWLLDLQKYEVGAVEDIVEVKFKKEIGLEQTDKYFNAGFLLINLKKWREENRVNQFIEKIIQHKGTVPHHDQGVLNSIFVDKALLLHPKYNVVTTFFEFKQVQKLKEFFNLNEYYSQVEFEEAKENPFFLHFTPSYSKRPWFKNSLHPFKEQYFNFLAKTNWKGVQLQKDNRKVKVLFLSYLFWNLGPGVVKYILKLKKL